MQVEGAHHVSINLASVEDAERFYGKLLGLHPIERPDFGIPGVWYQAGSIQLHVIVPPAGVEVGTRAPSLNPVASHIAFEIRDYEAAREALEREGVEILGQRTVEVLADCVVGQPHGFRRWSARIAEASEGTSPKPKPRRLRPPLRGAASPRQCRSSWRLHGGDRSSGRSRAG